MLLDNFTKIAMMKHLIKVIIHCKVRYLTRDAHHQLTHLNNNKDILEVLCKVNRHNNFQ